MGSRAAWTATVVTGIATSVVASYVYTAGVWASAALLTSAPLLYLSYVFVSGYTQLGIRFVYPRWGTFGSQTERLVRNCNIAFGFMTITGRTSLHRADVEAAIKERGTARRVTFRFLLFHPDSPHLVDFCANEGSNVAQTREKIINTTRNLLLLGAEHNICIEVRWYVEYPVWRMAIVDETVAHVGFYEKGRKGYEGARLVCPNQRRGGLYYAYTRVFEDAWQAATSAVAVLENQQPTQRDGTSPRSPHSSMPSTSKTLAPTSDGDERRHADMP